MLAEFGIHSTNVAAHCRLPTAGRTAGDDHSDNNEKPQQAWPRMPTKFTLPPLCGCIDGTLINAWFLNDQETFQSYCYPHVAFLQLDQIKVEFSQLLHMYYVFLVFVFVSHVFSRFFRYLFKNLPFLVQVNVLDIVFFLRLLLLLAHYNSHLNS